MDARRSPDTTTRGQGGLPLRLIRLAFTILAIGLCLFLIQASARFGFTRLLVRFALVTNSISVADEGVRLAPSDPETHRARATILNRLKMPVEAVKSLETATTLRYRDDYLWIELGNSREESGDMQGALVALDQAVRWAPNYAHTHWQRGNLLLRMRESNDAFAELRKAAHANPAYAPNLIDLAWGISREDIKTTEGLLEINDDIDRLPFIRFLARKGKGKELVEQLPLLKSPLSVENKTEFARLLFAAKAFLEAFELRHDSDVGESSILNGGFEEPLVFNDAGFGWIISPEQKNRLAIDVSEKLSGAKSLQINLDGNWTPGTPLLSQTFIVRPGQSYRLSLAIKTKGLVTGGPPIITVSEATSNQLLGKSENFPSATTPWLKLSLEFTVPPASQAAVVRLQRNSCDSSPCPIFGTLWLDEFYLEQTTLELRQ